MRKLFYYAFAIYFFSSSSACALNMEKWQTVFSGYGSVRINHERIILQPRASTQASKTHAALATGPRKNNPFTYIVTIKTISQLRQNSAPNVWEVGWIIWHYQDNDHFYYFIPKPNGWELGKRDPAYDGGQKFLATGNGSFPINEEYRIRITQNRKNRIKVYVDNKKIVSFTDLEDPYIFGKIGVYSEDARVRFSRIKTKNYVQKAASHY